MQLKKIRSLRAKSQQYSKRLKISMCGHNEENNCNMDSNVISNPNVFSERRKDWFNFPLGYRLSIGILQ